ncbi:MAG: phosphatidylserine decarboxylase [Planctomycetota bacterium]|jgi:phosphatidylserine decarboxylase|nr:phosphatidylserine decarboxylase [Planctomycetota bacterium]
MSLTNYGIREILLGLGAFFLFTLSCVLFAKTHGNPWVYAAIIPLAVLFVWLLYFFRDPLRVVPDGPGLIVSPADGVVTHVDTADEPDFIGGTALRCSIFLSIFNVHLNRAPVSGAVAFLKFRKGVFYDARNEQSLAKNQNQDVGLLPSEPGMPQKIVVRQSTGAIARRIVCPVTMGSTLERGEKYGMIKFGSRTTLFLSQDAKIEWLVKKGDKVKAGDTVLARIVAETGEGR